MCTYKERISYHESVEEEHKKNLEQQVDVILKMEEERLVLLREHKESTQVKGEFEAAKSTLEQEKRDLAKVNGELLAKVSLCEQSLSGLRDEVKQSKE